MKDLESNTLAIMNHEDVQADVLVEGISTRSTDHLRSFLLLNALA